MAKIQLSKQYRCPDDDCTSMGQSCPGHTITLDYLSVTNSYVWNDSRDPDTHIMLNKAQMQTAVDLLKDLSKSRKDAIKLWDES